MQRHILVVDDESPMRQLVRIHLAHAGYAVSEAADGRTCLDELKSGLCDLLILDVMMPGMDGMAVCRKVREQRPALPILMLTARDAVESRVTGLSSGADDYLIKPFDSRELLARVNGLFRRTHSQAGPVYTVPSIQLSVHLDDRKVLAKDHALTLTPKEFDLLSLFAKRPGRTFTREELLNLIWGPDYEGDTRTVDSHIKNIREKLKDAGVAPDVIATVWGIGYKLEASV